MTIDKTVESKKKIISKLDCLSNIILIHFVQYPTEVIIDVMKPHSLFIGGH